MAESPSTNSTGPLSVTLTSDGTAISDRVAIISMEVVARINTIPWAKVVFEDGDMAAGSFPLSDGTQLVPGAVVTIEAGYGGQTRTIFKGVLVKHGVRVVRSGHSSLVIECRDPAVKMTLARRNAVYTDLNDSEIASKLIGSHSGLNAEVEKTEVVHAGMVQYYATDWDFLLSRAEVNGQVVIADSGKITVAAPEFTGSAALVVTYGQDLIAFDAEMDARSQCAEIDAAAWDPETQELVKVGGEKPKGRSKQGNLTSRELAKVVGPKTFGLQSSAIIDKPQLSNWAKAAQHKAELARIRGRVSFQGNALAKPGSLITLKGVGDRFNGDAWIGSVQHSLSDGEWITEVELGLAPEWFVETHDVDALPASGRLPAIRGLHIGVVARVHEDPDNAYRVQVRIPVLHDDDNPVWARLSHAQASKGFGSFYVPEIDDEVVVGFIDDDPTQAIVMGSLYSKVNEPPYDMLEPNDIKAYVGRSKVKIEFDDERKRVMIETPGGHRMTLDDEDKKVCVEDSHGNVMTLDDAGIRISSETDISIIARRDISLEAGGNVNVEAKGDIKAEGINIEQSAKVGFKAKGGASAELSASGNTTVKGAMVMIN
ncbi:type VI secretion system tip protein VgrG [Granulosicoccus sp. 3-233]|uniref:type VI secretion system tip protein VgrG n=1 Tax=Granulosicoccus sp. 3-233 TaxID=3417969 RepID=UPI003D34750C